MAKILAVDDESKTRELLYEAFHGKGHEVTTAINADQALSVIGRQTFDIIILDNSMPGESGVSLLKKIRASGSRKNTAVCALKTASFAMKAMI